MDHVVTKQTINPGNTETMIYASILGTDSETGELIYLFIFSPLTPVGTTISILAKMLVIVTILSIFIGLVMSIVISRRLAQPLYSITDSAAQLAKGHYEYKIRGRRLRGDGRSGGHAQLRCSGAPQNRINCRKIWSPMFHTT